jgi:hypothetical protein
VGCLQQRDQRGQVLRPKQRSTSGYDDERISNDDVGPLRWDRLQVTVIILEVDAVLVPRLATHEKEEPSTMQWMERVSDPNPLLTVDVICS